QHAIVRPNGRALHIAQHRIREKGFLEQLGIAVTPYAPVRNRADLDEAIARIGFPSVLKTSSFGYDGKGQAAIRNAGDVESAWESLRGAEAILEAFVPLDREVSVIGARGVDGSWAAFAVFENVHTRHILDVTMSPASIVPSLAAQASEATRAAMAALDY